LVYGILDQKVCLRSNWLQEEDDEVETSDVISNLRLWHDTKTDDVITKSERKMLAASAGSELHIWNIERSKNIKKNYLAYFQMIVCLLLKVKTLKECEISNMPRNHSSIE
jgi:hypothetical protein